ncbi:MAG: hypothetical protein J0I06_28860 [Planctomycetes bacterium]|nr:hypothetical protein [Planctomycetota bacterium]
MYSEDGRAPAPAWADSDEYGHGDHTSPGAEKTLVLHRGDALNYDRPFAFLAETLLVDLWKDPFITSGVKALSNRPHSR